MPFDPPPCSVVNNLRLPVQRGVCAVQSLRLQPCSHPGSNSFRFSRVIRSHSARFRHWLLALDPRRFLPQPSRCHGEEKIWEVSIEPFFQRKERYETSLLP